MKARRFDPARAPQDQRKYSPTVGPALSPAMHNECDLTHIPNPLTVVINMRADERTILRRRSSSLICGG